MQQAAVRALRRASAKGEYKPRKQTNVRPTQWEHGDFVAVDGEGFSEGEEFRKVIGSEGRLYVGKPHHYAYLAASDGSEAYAPTGRLSLVACLQFLCGIVQNNPRAILVAFAASYDVTQMCAYDLGRDEIASLIGQLKPGDKGWRKVVVCDGEFDYVLEYRPRKCFTIQRWQAGARRWTHDKNGRRISTPHLTVRLWDVWGFFQDSFVSVLKKWLPGDPDFEFIRRMKGDRNVFHRDEIEDIKRYNAAELRCLAKVMNLVRDAINDLGLKITRWDGAGAIAAAMMTANKVKRHKGELSDEIFHAARCAYSGGHIEACKVGHYRGAVYHYDINSAYPNEFRSLPSLMGGRWRNGGGDGSDGGDGTLLDAGEPPAGYTLVKLTFSFPEGLPFYPLFYRCEDGTILYPASGSGWYWWPEYRAATEFVARFGCVSFTVEKWFNYVGPDGHERPFGWVADYYHRRQDYIAAANQAGLVSGPEKIIKLGLNSLYGKTAQQVGFRWKDGALRLPPFFQLDWAGYVTSGCRAKMMSAALQKPHTIIGFATDGLFSTEPLDLHCPKAKELGAWEFKVHDGITMVMPGVYWLHDGETSEHYSRGFDKANMKDADFVRQAWGRKSDSVAVSLTRLIGLGSACMSKEYWAIRGTFATSTRSLCLDGDNSKRYPINLRTARPAAGLVDTIPRDHFLPNIFGVPDSAPYPVAWLDGAVQRDMLEGEMADELEAMDAENA